MNVAGAISSAIATPTDVLKVRMQVHGRGTEQIGLIGCFREIYQYEGIRGLWRVRFVWHINKSIIAQMKFVASFSFVAVIYRGLDQQLKEVNFDL